MSRPLPRDIALGHYLGVVPGTVEVIIIITFLYTCLNGANGGSIDITQRVDVFKVVV